MNNLILQVGGVSPFTVLEEMFACFYMYEKCITFIYTEAVAQRCSVKKMFWNISQNSLEKTCARVSFLIKLQAEVCNFIKKGTLAQVYSSEFYEISRNIFSYKTSPLAASARSKFIMVEKIPPQIIHKTLLWTYITLHKKWSFPLRISPVNVTFGHIYCRNP